MTDITVAAPGRMPGEVVGARPTAAPSTATPQVPLARFDPKVVEGLSFAERTAFVESMVKIGHDRAAVISALSNQPAASESAVETHDLRAGGDGLNAAQTRMGAEYLAEKGLTPAIQEQARALLAKLDGAEPSAQAAAPGVDPYVEAFRGAYVGRQIAFDDVQAVDGELRTALTAAKVSPAAAPALVDTFLHNVERASALQQQTPESLQLRWLGERATAARIMGVEYPQVVTWAKAAVQAMGKDVATKLAARWAFDSADAMVRLALLGKSLAK